MAHSLRVALSDAGIAPPTTRTPREAERNDPGSATDANLDALRQRPGWLTERTVGIASHAVERYRERFEPHLDLRQAKQALLERLRSGAVVFSKERPRWLIAVPKTGEGVRNAGYVEIDGVMVFPLRPVRELPNRYGRMPTQPFYLVTCLYRLSFEGETPEDPAQPGGEPAGA